MKRAFIYGALAFMLLEGCSQDEIVQEEVASDSAIGFVSHVDKNSRAVTDATLNNLTQFKVWGAKTRNATTSESMTTIMNEQLVEKQSGLWTYSPLRYWVKGNAYLFNAFACNPANASSYYTYQLPNSIAAGTFSKYYQGTLNYSNGTDKANGNVDLIWANKNFVTISDNNPAPEVVRFTFGHMLCKINFKFLNEFTSNDEKLTVYDVKVKGAANGTLDMNGITVGTPVSGMIWSSTYNPADDKAELSYNFGGSGTDAQAAFKYGEFRTTEYRTHIPNQTQMVVSFKVKTQTMVDPDECLDIVTTIEPSKLINNENGFLCGYSYTLVAHLNQKTLGNLENIKFDVEKVDAFINYENQGSGEYIVDLTPSETSVSSSTNSAQVCNVHVASIKSKELVYLGVFVPEEYSYKWTLTSPDDAKSTVEFEGSSKAASPTIEIAAGTYSALSEMSVNLVATPNRNQDGDETHTLKFEIIDSKGDVVGSDTVNIIVSYNNYTTGGSLDGDDNDG